MLNAPAITELNVENAVYTIFAEWLGKYFDGQQHAVGGKALLPFPKALLQFGQSQIPPPLKYDTPAPLASIIMVWSSPISTDKRWETIDGKSQQMIYQKARWNYWVRVEKQGTDTMSARKVAHQTGKLLTTLLRNPATTGELAHKGIHKPCPGEPEPVAESGYVLMLVSCRALLSYPVLVK